MVRTKNPSKGDDVDMSQKKERPTVYKITQEIIGGDGQPQEIKRYYCLSVIFFCLC